MNVFLIFLFIFAFLVGAVLGIVGFIWMVGRLQRQGEL